MCSVVLVVAAWVWVEFECSFTHNSFNNWGDRRLLKLFEDLAQFQSLF